MKDELIKKLRELIGWCKTTNQSEVASILLTLVGSLYGNSTRELMKIVTEHSAKQILLLKEIKKQQELRSS